MAKSEKTNGAAETRKPRKRLGEWRREHRTMTVEGVGVVPYTVLVVTFEGHTWEVPDTKEGRHQGSMWIQGVVGVIKDRKRVERLRDQIRTLSQKWEGTAGDLLAKASDHLTTALEHMAKKE
jgi:hypothetical protein